MPAVARVQRGDELVPTTIAKFRPAEDLAVHPRTVADIEFIDPGHSVDRRGEAGVAELYPRAVDLRLVQLAFA